VDETLTLCVIAHELEHALRHINNKRMLEWTAESFGYYKVLQYQLSEL